MQKNIHATLDLLYSYIPERAPLYKDAFKILITTIISQRTKDSITVQSAKRLFYRFSDPMQLSSATLKEIETLIYPAGFYHQKAIYIKRVASIIVQKYHNRVPDTLDELVKLPGVGRKTANIVLSAGFGLYTIAVDTHVHRIANRLHWVKTNTPEETEQELTKIIKKRYWPRLNSTMVQFGQTICRPVVPRCNICPLNKFCPSAQIFVSKKTTKTLN